MQEDIIKTDDDQLDIKNVKIADDEYKIANAFLSKLTLVSETTEFEQIDVHLVMKALAGEITEENFY